MRALSLAIFGAASVMLGLQPNFAAGSIEVRMTLILLARASSTIDSILAKVRSSSKGPVFSATSFVPVLITTSSGFSSMTS